MENKPAVENVALMLSWELLRCPSAMLAAAMSQTQDKHGEQFVSAPNNGLETEIFNDIVSSE